MYAAPECPAVRVVVVFPENAKALWLKALERPEADLKCQAAGAIALARQRGMKGLETTIAPLLTAFDQPDQHPSVRLAIAQTLITLEAKETAPSLFRQSQSGSSELRDLVEPALARWDYRPAREEWLRRLNEPATSQRGLVLAIQGLGTVREPQAVERLRELVLSDRVLVANRLEAARALGRIRGEGLEKDAEQLAAVGTVTARLAAVSLLRQHRSEASIQLSKKLAEDQEPAVTGSAVARLHEIDPDLVVPFVDRLLGSADPNLRSLGVEVLCHRPTEKHVRMLADRLDDLHPAVRVKARRSLLALAEKKEFRDPVFTEGTRMLATQEWRGLEQATILLVLLEHKAAADRLVELLSFARPEVSVTAAWGVRRLAVPETLPAVLKYVEAQRKRVIAASANPAQKDVPLDVIDHQLSQLNQFLGQQKFGPADGVLRQFIPRMEKPMTSLVLCPEARAAAIWAVGLINEGKSLPAVAKALEARLADTGSIPPEEGCVRRMAAITLGRLDAKDAVPTLRTFCPDFEPSENPINNACGWALERLTGDAMPPPKTIQRIQRDGFLMPQD
jgi:HEAT repeat protein